MYNGCVGFLVFLYEILSTIRCCSSFSYFICDADCSYGILSSNYWSISCIDDFFFQTLYVCYVHMINHKVWFVQY
jgi:hypothetical protein